MGALLGAFLVAGVAGADVTVPTNHAGWPLVTYPMFVGALGPGEKERSHAVAHHIAQRGWAPFVEEKLAPIFEGPNPPAELLLHCVGPAWPRMKEGEPKRIGSARYVQRWFEYDWPLTVAEGREREDGQGRWRPMPMYVDDFSSTWRRLAAGDWSGGYPLKTYAYTGLLQTPWLEALRRDDPTAYRQRVVEVARFFRDAGFAGMYVDASAERKLPPDHLGLQLLKEIDAWPDFFVGVEAYPPAKHDDTTGPLRYFLTENGLATQHPGWLEGRKPTWQSRLEREGLILWRHRGGSGRRVSPELAQKAVGMGDRVAIAWTEWPSLARSLPLQQAPALDTP